jgi:parallel beta-helix repeat protein
MKRFSLVLILLPFLLSLLISFQSINIVKASGTVYIRADGLVDPIDSPIQRSDNVYRLTDNIYDFGIVVQKDNVVIDGVGCSLGSSQKTADFDGIVIYEQTNVTVKNLNILNLRYGVLVINSSYCNILSNTIVANISYCGNLDEIKLESSNNCKVMDNDIKRYLDYGHSFSGYGIHLSQCSSINIQRNRIDAWTGHGEADIRIEDSYNNTVAENVLTSNDSWEGYARCAHFSGIELDGSLSNWIDGNTLKNLWWAMMLDYSPNNTITGNNFEEDGLAFFLDQSPNNTIYHNNFKDCTAYDIHTSIPSSKPSINLWDNGLEGNYWSNYAGVDGNRDGICDTPYVIDAHNIDHYPLMIRYQLDITSPTISILSPQNTTYHSASVALSFTVNETTSWTCYSLDGQDNLTVSGNFTLTELVNGSHRIVVYAKDMSENMGASDLIYFSVDTNLPWTSYAITITAIVGGILLIGTFLIVRIKKSTMKSE